MEEGAGKFKVRVGDGAGWVGKGDQLLLNVLGKRQAPDDWRGARGGVCRGLATEPNGARVGGWSREPDAACAVTGSIMGPKQRRWQGNQLGNPCGPILKSG